MTYHTDILTLSPILINPGDQSCVFIMQIIIGKHAHAIYRKKKCCENENFHWKIFDIFLIFAQNIDCGYTLEPPR